MYIMILIYVFIKNGVYCLILFFKVFENLNLNDRIFFIKMIFLYYGDIYIIILFINLIY